ncbi:conserved Plasmodium protein, unknown function [Plasmodium sp. gorilla clade G2]|uniref:conserved Plasmodium protein, unknown function n=1 Tax=Plasmodium sp. gorilla clade G2 TaxID=880535 RepID=UPI000D21EF32|nr:conserved Plasmodium protein, unknown function [Plasmodium sp. gorilla clade G2]SOV14884.1 conserved Plasmodium protein, unknown function [Plasmodium sp. gorilla clade G2]
MEDTEPDDEGEEYIVGKNIIHNNFYNQNFIKKFLFENIESKEINNLKRNKKSNNNKKFIIHLVPSKNSSFYNFLKKKKNDVLKKYGQDETYKYDIHISVTGYFCCDNINVFIKTLYHFMFQYLKLYYTFKKVIFKNLYFHISLPNKAEVESFILKKDKIKYQIKKENTIKNVNPTIFKNQLNHYNEDEYIPPEILNQKYKIEDIKKKDLTYTKNIKSYQCVENVDSNYIKEKKTKKNSEPIKQHVLTTDDGYVIVPIHCEWLKRILDNFFFIIKNNNVISYNTITNDMYTINKNISKIHDSMKKKYICFNNNNMLSYDPYKSRLLLLKHEDSNSNISSNITSNMNNSLDVISSSNKSDTLMVQQYINNNNNNNNINSNNINNINNINSNKMFYNNHELNSTSFVNTNCDSNTHVDNLAFNKTINSFQDNNIGNTLICNNNNNIDILNYNNNNNSHHFFKHANHVDNNLNSNKSDSSDKTNNSKKERKKKKSNHNNKKTDSHRKDAMNKMSYKYNNFKVNVSDFRVKDCNHISLACNRNNKYIQKNIANMYKDIKYYFLNCSWDLVMFEWDQNVFPQANKQNKFLNEIFRVKNFAVS